MSEYIRTLPPWPEPAVPATGLFFFYDPDTDEEYRLLPAQLASLFPGSDPYQLTEQELLAKLAAGTGITLTLEKSKVLISCSLTNAPAPEAPDAPGDGRVDDAGNNLNGTLVAGFPAAADYEVFGVPGFAGIVNLAAAGGNAEGGRIFSRGLMGSIDVGATGIRVAASGARPAGRWLLNNRAFTGPAAVPRGYQLTYSDTYPAAA